MDEQGGATAEPPTHGSAPAGGAGVDGGAGGPLMPSRLDARLRRLAPQGPAVALYKPRVALSDSSW